MMWLMMSMEFSTRGINELEKNKNKIVLYNEILTNGMELYRRDG